MTITVSIRCFSNVFIKSCIKGDNGIYCLIEKDITFYAYISPFNLAKTVYLQ